MGHHYQQPSVECQTVCCNITDYI